MSAPQCATCLGSSSRFPLVVFIIILTIPIHIDILTVEIHVVLERFRNRCATWVGDLRGRISPIRAFSAESARAAVLFRLDI